MGKRIVYLRDDGGLDILIPAPQALQTMTIEAIAAKDVPTGLSYKIVEESEIPSDRSQRGYWTINPLELTDGVGA